MAEVEQEGGDYQIRPEQDRKFKCGIVKVGKYFNKLKIFQQKRNILLKYFLRSVDHLTAF